MSETALMKPQAKTKVITSDSNNSSLAQFSKWLYNETVNRSGSPNGKIISAGRCVFEINKILGLSRGTSHKRSYIHSWISKAREHFEEKFNCTIWPVYGVGWRASTKLETARMAIKVNCRAAAWAHRARRINTITEERFIDQAVRAEYHSIKGKVHALSASRQSFFNAYLNYKKKQDSQEKALTNGNKLIPQTT